MSRTKQDPANLAGCAHALCGDTGASLAESHRTGTVPARLHGLLVRRLLDGVLLVPSPRRQVRGGGLGACGSCFWGPRLHWNNLGGT